MVPSWAWILLATALYGLVHSLAASLGAKAVARHTFGPRGERFYRLGFNLIGLFTLLPVLALAAALPDRILYAVPFPWSVFLLLVQAAAVGMLVVGVFQTGLIPFLGLDAFLTPRGSSPAQLVIRGLYRWIRHPLYIAGMLFLWASPVMSANQLALSAGFTLYLIIGAYFEERKLLREFGPAYAEYQKVTPMFVPFFKGPSR